MRPCKPLSVVLSFLSIAAFPALASPSGVVISSFQVRGPAGGNDEYIELRNTSGGNVDISAWKLQGCGSASPGTAGTRATVAAGVTLTAGQYYLFTNNGSGGYSGSVVGDATYATGFTDFSASNYSGVQLLDTVNTKQDGVGSPLSPCREGTGFTTPTTSGASDAYARTQDTDNNVADFAGPQATNPHNSGGIVAVCPNDGLHIYTIQGRGHVSPYNTQCVNNVPGIVTQVVNNGFYMQDGDGDGDPATSDGIFVFTGGAPSLTAGQQVKVKGTVNELRPGSTFTATNCPAVSGACNLTVTEITAPTVTPASGLFANITIVPTVIGVGGRMPPSEFVDSGTNGSVEVPSQTTYDPNQNGIDFYESLEGMLVQLNNVRVVGPTNKYGEIWLLGDNGMYTSGVNARGGVTLIDHGSYVDYNPERVMIDVSLLTSTYPKQNVGDTAPVVVGAMSYDFGDFRVFPISLPNFASGGLQPATSTVSVGADRLRIVSYNLENLNANENDLCDVKPDTAVADGRFAREGQHIAVNLGAPDILGVEEIQDTSGCTDDGVVEASLTLNTLLQAIFDAGGPAYAYALIDPVNDQDGGIPGGNIRQAILFNPTRVTFVPGTTGAGDATTPTALSTDANGHVLLTLSPGRIDPNNAAWTTSRKPLAATFDFNGRRVLVIVNHFDSKGGDEPLFGRFQPPVFGSAVQRVQQAQVEHDFIAQALSLDAGARIVSLGDFNDFDFSAPMQTLTADGTMLTDLATALLPPQERYSYVYEGNSQELDHIYVSAAFVPAAEFQPLHVNSEFANQVSDHDPMISSLRVVANQPPVAVVGADQSANEGVSVALDGSASYDADGNIASYSWTQTSGAAVTLQNATSATPSFTTPHQAGTLVFTLSVTDNEGASATATTQVTVVNQAPVANAGANQTANEGVNVTLDGFASNDPDGNIASYSWTQTAGPAVVLQNASSATPSFVAPHQAGTLAFTLTVTDNEGATAAAMTQVTVVNQTPFANAGANQTVNEGASVTLNGAASSDPDGSIASYAWTQTSGPAVTLQNANTATPSFTAPHQAGTLTFALTVTDNEGATASAATQVTVVNQAPVANAGPDQIVKYNALVNLDGRASHDADGSIVSYRWVQTGGSAVTLTGATTATPSFRAPHADGHLTFALTVTDNEGAQATDAVIVSTAKK
jgi:predicted extracellular nuclease